MKIHLASFLSIFFIISLLIDAVLNYFFNIPFLVGFYIIVSPVLVFLVFKSDKSSFLLILFYFIIFILGEIRYGFQLKDLEVIQLLIFFLSVSIFIKQGPPSPKTLKVTLNFIFFVAFLMISTAFLGINSGHLANTINANVSMKEIEYLRKYNQGLFRIPQLAAYLFGFLFLSTLFLAKKLNLKIYYFVAVVCFVLMLYTGVRTVIFAILIAYFLTFLRIRRLPFVLAILVISLFFFVNIQYFLHLSRGTILFQYFTFIYSVVNNFSTLSRVQIWVSWWNSLSEFSILDFLIGKTFHQSTLYNFKSLGINIWFHNDFLGVAYTTGIIGFSIYFYFIIRLFRSLRGYFQNNRLIYVAFISIILCAVFNGFYYYLPFVMLYLIYIMKSVLVLKSSNE